MESFPKNLSNHILTSFDYSSGDETDDDENIPILSQNQNNDDKNLKNNDQEKYDKNIIKSVHNLNRIIYAIFVTILLAVILYLIDVSSGFTIPIFMIFIVLWIGHLFILGIVLKIMRRILRSMIKFTDKFNGGELVKRKSADTESNHVYNVDNRSNMIVFLFFQSNLVIFVSVFIIIAELLVLLNVYNLVPAYSPTIPLYFIIVASILYAILFRYFFF